MIRKLETSATLTGSIGSISTNPTQVLLFGIRSILCRESRQSHVEGLCGRRRPTSTRLTTCDLTSERDHRKRADSEGRIEVVSRFDELCVLSIYIPEIEGRSSLYSLQQAITEN